MCGRYHIAMDEDTIREMSEIVKEIDNQLANGNRDIYPSNSAPILRRKNHLIELDTLQWGFPGFSGSKRIINARAESLFERKMFRESVISKRILIPSSYFYEWDSEKRKHSFLRRDKKMMFLAGLYDTFDNEDRFVIITTSANDSVRLVHHRMPLIIEKDQIETWLFADGAIQEMLSQIPVSLTCKSEYTQLTLDL